LITGGIKLNKYVAKEYFLQKFLEACFNKILYAIGIKLKIIKTDGGGGK